MFEKFTDKARRVLVLAQEEARELEQPYVGTEHLLLGLIREGEGIAARALHQLNVTYDEVISQIKEITDQDAPAAAGHIPLPRAPSACSRVPPARDAATWPELHLDRAPAARHHPRGQRGRHAGPREHRRRGQPGA